jgi:hypothetical protein
MTMTKSLRARGPGLLPVAAVVLTAACGVSSPTSATAPVASAGPSHAANPSSVTPVPGVTARAPGATAVVTGVVRFNPCPVEPMARSCPPGRKLEVTVEARSPGGRVLASSVTAVGYRYSLPLAPGRYVLVVTGLLARCQDVPISVRGRAAVHANIVCWHSIH